MRKPEKLERLSEAKTIDDVLHNMQLVIDWSIRADSTIGYFAVLYKRATVAIHKAMDQGVFDDAERMDRVAARFAQRYFASLNGYFYPDEFDPPSLPWEVSFVADATNQTTMVQNMLAGLNAHINYDLALTTAAEDPDSLDTFERDFNLINAYLGGQITGALDATTKISPTLTWFRRAIPKEVWLIKWVLVRFRNSAWLCAIRLAEHPEDAHEMTVNQTAWAAALGAWYLDPPRKYTPFHLVFRAIAAKESKDVGDNVAALDSTSERPEMSVQAFL